jgi:hypothetical protein
MPKINRTADIWWMLCTNAVPIDAIPKHMDMMGINQPGPIHLQQMFDGIWLCELRRHVIVYNLVD